MEVVEFLKDVLDAQVTVTILALIISTILVLAGIGDPSLWKDLMETTVTVFVGGGFLRDAATSLANRT